MPLFWLPSTWYLHPGNSSTLIWMGEGFFTRIFVAGILGGWILISSVLLKNYKTSYFAQTQIQSFAFSVNLYLVTQTPGLSTFFSENQQRRSATFLGWKSATEYGNCPPQTKHNPCEKVWKTHILANIYIYIYRVYIHNIIYKIYLHIICVYFKIYIYIYISDVHTV